MDNKWHKRFLELAEHVSTWSKDTTKVGAVIVNPDTKQVVGMGYNGFPRGVEDTPERLADRDTKYKFVCHAEVNAVIAAGKEARGCNIYVTPTMMAPNACPECSKVIVQAGIKNVYGWQNDNLTDRWQDLAKFSDAILSEGGVEWHTIEK